MTDTAAAWPGSPFPLGATFDGAGTNFSVFSEAADSIELCLFDEEGTERRLTLAENDAGCWHAYLPSAGPDGENYNRSWNRGAEGETDDECVLRRRDQVRAHRMGDWR